MQPDEVKRSLDAEMKAIERSEVVRDEAIRRIWGEAAVALMKLANIFKERSLLPVLPPVLDLPQNKEQDDSGNQGTPNS